MKLRQSLSIPSLLLVAALNLTPLFGPAPAAGVEGECKKPKFKGYSYEVLADGLKAVDNLAFGSDGLLYATLERRGGKGSVVSIDKDGKVKTVVDGLNRPDGLRSFGDDLYIVEEVGEGRLLRYNLKSASLEVITTLGKLEGLAIISDREILVTMDMMGGRLIKVTLTEGKPRLSFLTSPMKRPEGIAMGPGGAVYIAETHTGKVLIYKGDGVEDYLTDLDNPDQLLYYSEGHSEGHSEGQSDGGGDLYIAEDNEDGRVLRYRGGALSVLGTCVDSPQGLIIGDDGYLYLSEQGRGRILKLKKR